MHILWTAGVKNTLTVVLVFSAVCILKVRAYFPSTCLPFTGFLAVRVHLKAALLVSQALHGSAPSYPSDILIPYVPPRSLRSSDQALVVVPRAWWKLGGEFAWRPQSVE